MQGMTEKLIEAVEEALEAWSHTRIHGRPAQGGEQNGNLECVEIAYDNLKYALENYRAADSGR